MSIVDLVERVRLGVAQVMIERNRQFIGAGTAFLIEGGLITNSHCLPEHDDDVVAIRFDDHPPTDHPPIRLRLGDLEIPVRSPDYERDYAYIKCDEAELQDRYVFDFGVSTDIAVPEEVLFLGFPFGGTHLTAHLGHVSSVHKSGVARVIQIDGSVNGGNSGGPLIDLKTGKVVGVVSRAHKGFAIKQFDRLLEALRHNKSALLAPRGARVQIGGVDPVQALGKSFAAMEQIALDLRKSANVGIGYAFSSDALREDIAMLRA